METQKHDRLPPEQQQSDRTDYLASDSGIENLSSISNLSGGTNSCASPRTFIHDRSRDHDYNGDSARDHRLSTRVSTDSSSTFELVDFSNSPEDGNDSGDNENQEVNNLHQLQASQNNTQPPNELNLLLRHTEVHRLNQQTVSKPCEIDLHEERDTFSPVNSAGYLSDQQQDDAIDVPVPTVSAAPCHSRSIDFTTTLENDTNSAGSLDLEDNKIYEKKRLKTGATTSTKEEKQRQNEEIVIMETSSISSETGSWESVFPQQKGTNLEVKECCQNFLQNERNCCTQSSGVPLPDGLDPSNCGTNPSSLSSVTACFIDASTLLDEPEVAYSSLGSTLADVPCLEPKPCPTTTEKISTLSNRSEEAEMDIRPKQKSQTLRNNSNSSSSGDSPNKYSSADENTNNLSDEEKLWKRKNSKKESPKVDVKDQFVRDNAEVHPIFGSVDKPKSSSVSRQTTLDSDDRECRQRREQERIQGTLIFQNSIQQFSGHLISPKMHFPDENISDYGPNSTTGWSETTSSNFGDASDCGESSSNYNSHIQSESEASMSCILPDTPHNSIMQVDGLNRLRDLAGNLHSVHAEDSSAPIKIPKRSTRCDDSAPIVSGGASIKDFTPKQCESPPVRRKTDSCPIVSGGLISFDCNLAGFEDKTSSKDKPKNSSQPFKSWVVDMSDCQSRRRRSTSSSSSTENTARTADNSTSEQRNSGLGFYVSLNDMQEPKSGREEDSQRRHSSGRLSRSYHDQVKKPTGFYIDFSESENSRTATPPPSADVHTPPTNGSGNGNDSKKNIFSMFIDFGEKRNVRKREPLSLASRLSTSLTQKRESDSMKSSCSSIETVMTQSTSSHCGQEKFDSTGEAAKTSSDESKKPSYIFMENDSPIMRRTPLRSVAKDESKRHSWNNPEPKNAHLSNREHKRSISLVADNSMMNIIDKLPIISKTSSMSIDSSLSPFDDFTCSKSELSTYSNNSNSATSVSIHSSGNDDEDPTKKQKKRRRDVHINETFDKSSQGSLTDGVFSKESSPVSTTDTEDLTFQQEENMCIAAEEAASSTSVSSKEGFGRPGIMETIIETKETSSPKKQPTKNVAPVEPKSHTMETLHATIEKQKQLLETVTEHVEAGSAFVKLSDMDKPISKFELHSPENAMSKSVGSRHISRLFQEPSRSRPHSWNMTRSIGNNIANITSSVENLKSLSRLFPHLSRELSSSLPGDVSFDMFSRSPHDNGEYGQSDFSGASSLASSISRSGMDESSISCRQPRRLGEDLLKMFLQEIGTDVVVEVNGRRIKAHKCILRSRCQYFAAMLSGGWVQSAGNMISLPGYSYSSVHFALCHIYSGASHPPDGISLMELAALADLLGLEGLKEVTAHSLKLNYCHNFHKPCSGCIDGILQVLPVALNHALDDLYRKCLKWTCRYYMKVWPTRSFAQLPSDIFARCRQMLVAHLTTETVLETILDCDHLISQLAPCRWAAAIENLVRDILDAAYGYLSDHFASLIASDSFLSLGHDKSHNISRLETILLRTASSLLPDQSCRSYQRITRLNAVLAAKVIKVPGMSDHGNDLANGRVTESLHDHEEEMEWNEEFIRLVSAILSAVEQCLTKQCARAMRVAAWQRMDLELRKKIQKLACLTEPLDLRRNKNIPKQINFNTSGNRSQDLYQVKLAIQAHSKRALAQDTQLYRATAHTQTNNVDSQNKHIQTNEKGVQANNEVKEMMGKVFKSSSKSNILHQPQNSIKPKPDKVKILGHRRTHSEDSSTSTKHSSDFTAQKPITTVSASRLADIRPRYLEPRKLRTGPLKSQTSSNIPSLKGKHISSSDSSRTSSPATGRNAKNAARKIGTKSTNMSLDSLASPSKKASITGKLKGRCDMDISIDSLGDSMKSSMKTDKTISQESLIRCDNMKDNKISRSHPVINKENLQSVKSMPNKFARNKPLSCQTTSGSSPSSVTNKSGRLSSNTSSMNSPRDAFKNRSISVPAGSTNNNVRKSFLTPKSREILARKSAAAKLNESTSSTEKAPHTNAVYKSSSSSNIPTRRGVQPNNLHQRRSLGARPISNSLSNPTQSSQLKCVQRNNSTSKADRRTMNEKNDRMGSKKIVYDNNRKEKELFGRCGERGGGEEKIELVIEGPHGAKEMRIESKLERSSTFCKEVSDLPVSELQIIE
ncbi:unnamed protein product [Hermetia illucens]|uniref:BTB domain-containing protein n=1 Tax=Hermetia illucens TaxID=343691 RepID=A0A7R8YRJ3_HERIL|nr:uncharacterized protein LOC119650168 [Hermetia illucens]XP_037908646.1 uncharacterized protein LOC119650168 [Hermetia illucens]CAD7082926.1 unnamed protein product [Hermetia illucens]